MKIKIMFSLISFLIIFSLNACSIEGEQVCGVWNAQGDYGKMKLEITPWEGKFHAYLLEYKTGNETIKGAKEEEFIFLTDLVFKNGKYQNGKIYFDINSEEYCTISLEMLGENQLKATYNCEGQTNEEIWNREGFSSQKTTKLETKDKTINTNKTTSNTKTKEQSTKPSVKKETASQQSNSKKIKKVKKETEETTNQSTFYIIGVHQTVDYQDTKEMEKTIETLWEKTYNEDFSSKLNNIADQTNMYVAYSDYDKPKGKMTITIGYKVKDLSNIPSGLKGVKIPMNNYLVYPLSGEKSDFEGDGWNELAELMAYRKADSGDFEIYTFDSNYKVKKAEMWIATK